MNIEPFYELIRSGDSTNAEIAWQIARGMRDSGDKDFEAFCKAVYGWSFSDIPNQKPAEFLSKLFRQRLQVNILRKKMIPNCSYSLSELINTIKINDIQTDSFPIGFEVFKNVSKFEFGVQTFHDLGKEIAQLKKLTELIIDTRFEFEIREDFAENSQLNTLSVHALQSLILPKSLASSNIKWLKISTKKFNDAIWSYSQLKKLSFKQSYGMDWEESINLLSGLPELQNLESLKLDFWLNFYDDSIKYIPDFMFELKNLKELSVVNDERNAHKIRFNANIKNLDKLETLKINNLDYNELKHITKLPNLKLIYIKNKRDFSKIEDLLNASGKEICLKQL